MANPGSEEAEGAKIMRLPTPQPPFTLAVCALFHNEAPNLREWVLYHYLVGFQHFFMYDNNSTDGPLSVLQPLIDRGLVTYIFWPYTQQKYVAQIGQIRHCFNTSKLPSVAKWVGGFDIDEYVVVLPQRPSIKPFLGSEPFVLHRLLSHYESQNEGALVLDRVVFTSNGHRTRPHGLTISEYTQRMVDVYPTSAAGKVIVLSQAMAIMNTFHTVSLKANWRIVNADHRPWVEHSRYRTWEPIRMAHFQQRSYEECIAKFSSGRLSPDHWRMLHGKTLCDRHMEGYPGFDKTSTTVDKFLPNMGFPEMITDMILTMN